MHRLAALPLAFLLAAWGPHPEITDAGLAALGKDHPLLTRLGSEAGKLREYCWMADHRRSLRDDYYPDDYLLFPGAPRHYDHLCPEVKATYDPYFRRALQALRTETAPNAARWIGSILHFAEDTGSPPHAAEIRGDVHSKMENWIDGTKIRIDGYRPQLLGETDDAAVAGFLRRMDGLIAYSKERGLKLKPRVEAGDRPACEPMILECALETSRVVADLLHTLGTLGDPANRDGATLRGAIRSQDPPGLGKVPAKVMLEGTLFSTLADPSGIFEFRNLPAGAYRLIFLRAGSETGSESVMLEKNGRASRDVSLRESGQLLRNGDFLLRWENLKTPDCWHAGREAWEGESIPVHPGLKLRLSVRWKKEAQGGVAIRWRSSPDPQGGLSSDEPPMEPGEESRVVAVPEKMTHARVILRGGDAGIERVALAGEP
jgi:hypothetical protein